MTLPDPPSPADSADPLAVLGLAEDASLQEMDEQYFELVQHWTIRSRQGIEEARHHLQMIDDAYKTLLSSFMSRPEESLDSFPRTYTMAQVTNAQDRIQLPSNCDDDLWYAQGIESARSPSPLLDTHDKGQNVGSAPGFSIAEIVGDVFDAPDRAVIVHSVNCQGVWGYGIAAHLQKKFPEAFKIYQKRCRDALHAHDLVGTCLLITPQQADYEMKMTVRNKDSFIVKGASVFNKRRWIACLFTSIGYGKPNKTTNNPGRDSEDLILRNTRHALEELRARLEQYGPSNFDEETSWETDDNKPGGIWSCRFNSGAFGVDWDKSRRVLEDEFRSFERPWTIVQRG